MPASPPVLHVPGRRTINIGIILGLHEKCWAYACSEALGIEVFVSGVANISLIQRYSRIEVQKTFLLELSEWTL